MPKAFFKHKLLLDENMPHRLDFPNLNQQFDVKHVVKDLHLMGIDDPSVYSLAVTQKRIILTRNIKDFAALAGTRDDYGIIAIPPHWKPELLDSKLTALLKKQNSSFFQKRLVTLTEE